MGAIHVYLRPYKQNPMRTKYPSLVVQARGQRFGLMISASSPVICARNQMNIDRPLNQLESLGSPRVQILIVKLEWIIDKHFSPGWKTNAPNCNDHHWNAPRSNQTCSPGSRTSKSPERIQICRLRDRSASRNA